MELTQCESSLADLDPVTLYALLKLRCDVFVVEQNCPYPDLDGRDAEPGTRHVWLAPPGARWHPFAYLRILAEPDGSRRIGRVCTAPAGRGAGLSGRLLAAVIAAAPAAVHVLDAQSYLVDFYARFGFEVAGDEHVEDGILHTPMRRSPTGGQPSG